MPKTTLQKLTRHLARLGKAQKKPLPGFDSRHYLALNSDVAAAFSDPKSAENHYTSYGVDELRQVMPEGLGIEDRAHRMLITAQDRQDWGAWLRRQGDLHKLLARHPRRA